MATAGFPGIPTRVRPPAGLDCPGLRSQQDPGWCSVGPSVPGRRCRGRDLPAVWALVLPAVGSLPSSGTRRAGELQSQTGALGTALGAESQVPVRALDHQLASLVGMVLGLFLSESSLTLAE